MHEEDLWSDLASGLSNTVPSNTSPKNTISIAIDDVSKANSKKVNSNEAVLRIDLSKGLIQPPPPLTPLLPAQPILEDLWSETSDISLSAELPDLSTPANEPLSSQDQESAGSESTAVEEVSPETLPKEETDDLFEADLWGGLEEEEDEADEAMFEEESSRVLDEFESLSLQEEADSPTDWSNSSSSAEDITSDFFAALEQSTPQPNIESREGPDTLLANFGLLDIEAELAEQERLEAEIASRETEAQTADKAWRERAPAWMKSLSVIYIDWQDQRKAEQEALERLGYANLTISKETRAFIIQAARAARLTHRQEKELTSELAQLYTKLAFLYDLGSYKAKRQKLEAEIAELERQLASRRYLWQRDKQLATQLASARAALEQVLAQDPYEFEGRTLKARVAEIERELVTSMQWVAVKKAPQFLGQGIELDDLIQYGMLGIIAGVRRFDHTRGARLLTVVEWWVFQALARAVAGDERLIRLPVHVHESLAQIKKQHAKLEMSLGRLPTRQELASAVQLSVKRLEDLLHADRTVISLNRYIDAEDDEEGFSFQSVEEALIQGEDTISAEIEQESTQLSIKALLNCLTLRERQVVELRYGLFDNEEHTLEETGRRLKVTRERVRQIQERAEKKLNWHGYRLKLHQRPATTKTKTNH